MRDSIDIHVGWRMRQRRWFLGLSLQELSNKVGRNFQQLQKYESGANRISASRMWEIAGAMGVPMSYFFEGIDGRTSEMDEVRDKILADREAVDLVRAVCGIPKENRQHFIDLACALGDPA